MRCEAEGHLHRRNAALFTRAQHACHSFNQRWQRRTSHQHEPNLQKHSYPHDLGRTIRRAFADMVVLISPTLSIELRVLAQPRRGGASSRVPPGEDIHDRTAPKVFGPNSGLDKHELRRRAKIINYALLYGKTAFTLARDIGVTPPVAQEFIDAYFGGFPRVREFIDRTIEQARSRGFVETMFGRRRMVPELNSRNHQIRQGAERMTVNFPIQGTAADILKRAMLRVHGALNSGARMILTVHDELLIESPQASATEVAKHVREAMEGAAALTVPLTVDVGIGPNWREAKP